MNMQHNDKKHANGYLLYLLVWFALLILTGLTVSVAGINFGRFTVATALVIAAIKAYLVLTIFMHLKTEDRTFKIFVGVSLLFLIVSFTLLFSDYSFM
jgi:cytochrome c oxidase subunit 4